MFSREPNDPVGRSLASSELRSVGPEACLIGGGQLGAQMRSMKWEAMPIGPVAGWPPSLRTAIAIMLGSPLAMVIVWGPESYFFYNDGVRPILGAATEGSVPGMPFPESWPFIGPLMARTRAGESVSLDDQLIPGDQHGHLANRYFTLSCSPIRDESGGVGGMLAVVSDTTARVEEVRRLTANVRGVAGLERTFFDVAVLKMAPVAISLFALPERRYQHVNAAHVRMMGRDLTGLSLEEAFPDMTESEHSSYLAMQDRVQLTGTPTVILKSRVATPDGTRFYDATVGPWVDAEGVKRGLITVSTDVTDLVRANVEIETSERRLYELFMQTPTPICVFRGPDLVYEMANDLYYKVAGRTHAILGQALLDAIPEARGQGFDDILRRVMTTGEAFVGAEMPLKIDLHGRGQLEDTWWTFLYAPLRDSDGTIGRVIAVVHNVTEQVLAAQGREAQIEALERTLRFSELFVGVLGHDLQNPLSAIMTAAQLLEVRAESERIATPVGRIVESAERMERMISQLLDLTRLRLCHGLPIDPVLVDLAQLTKSIIDELEQAHRCRIELEVVGDVTGTWDRDRIAQMTSNLAVNACQHGLPGAPVRIRIDGTTADMVRIEVRNAGSIAPEILVDLFEPLRERPAKHIGAQGLGLGLYITKAVAMAHGGSIAVDSSKTAGTRFVVELPRRSDARVVFGDASPPLTEARS